MRLTCFAAASFLAALLPFGSRAETGFVAMETKAPSILSRLNPGSNRLLRYEGSGSLAASPLSALSVRRAPQAMEPVALRGLDATGAEIRKAGDNGDSQGLAESLHALFDKKLTVRASAGESGGGFSSGTSRFSGGNSRGSDRGTGNFGGNAPPGDKGPGSAAAGGADEPAPKPTQRLGFQSLSEVSKQDIEGLKAELAAQRVTIEDIVPVANGIMVYIFKGDQTNLDAAKAYLRASPMWKQLFLDNVVGVYFNHTTAKYRKNPLVK